MLLGQGQVHCTSSASPCGKQPERKKNWLCDRLPSTPPGLQNWEEHDRRCRGGRQNSARQGVASAHQPRSEWDPAVLRCQYARRKPANAYAICCRPRWSSPHLATLALHWRSLLRRVATGASARPAQHSTAQHTFLQVCTSVLWGPVACAELEACVLSTLQAGADHARLHVAGAPHPAACLWGRAGADGSRQGHEGRDAEGGGDCGLDPQQLHPAAVLQPRQPSHPLRNHRPGGLGGNRGQGGYPGGRRGHRRHHHRHRAVPEGEEPQHAGASAPRGGLATCFLALSPALWRQLRPCALPCRSSL